MVAERAGDREAGRRPLESDRPVLQARRGPCSGPGRGRREALPEMFGDAPARRAAPPWLKKEPMWCFLNVGLAVNISDILFWSKSRPQGIFLDED